jgi:ectoine hydroxylase-related dioxygenase (phytanoyl-CoA dioxygenase family)
MQAALPIVDPDIADLYQRDGFYVVEQLLSPEECDALKAESLRVLREHWPPGATVMVGVAASSHAYHRLASDPRIVRILERIMPSGVAFMSDKFVLKSGGKRFATPWHVDKFYWANTRPKVSVWIALDDVSEKNGALKVVRGSHRHSWAPHSGKISQTNGEFVHVIDSTHWTAQDEVTCQIEKGGAIFFSDNLVHGSTPNSAGIDRFAIISTYHAPVSVEEPFDLQFPARHVIIPNK